MKVAVMSDTHDNLETTGKAIRKINEQRPGALLHCGDLCSPFMVERLAAFKGPAHIVFGNNEGDRFTIERVSRRFPDLTLHGEFGFVEAGDGEIAFTHRPEFARGFASTGEYAAVFYGHTHRHSVERIGDTWLVNPGELMGLVAPPGYIIFDLAKGTCRRFTV